MTFGGEMDIGSTVTDGRFPTVSVIVAEWVKKQEERANGGYPVGARLAAMVTGTAGQKFWVHWRAEGKAMRNPAIDMTGDAL